MTALILFAVVLAVALRIGLKAIKERRELQLAMAPHLRAGREAY